MVKTTVSQKYQVVIPKEIRDKAVIKEGQEMYVYSIGKSIILTPLLPNRSERMLGLGQETWKDIDPLEYIRQERLNWDKKYGR